MKRYPKYKDSGLDWIGDVPEEWIKKKITYCFQTIGSGTTPTSGRPEYYEDGTHNWLQTGDLNDNEIWETSKKITSQGLSDFSSLKFYPINSIVIAMYGATIGKMGILKIETTTNQACCVLSRNIGVDEKFIFYWFISVRNHIISLSYGGGQPNINQDIIRNLRLHVPPLIEQSQLVDFLDQKTSIIDDLIQKKLRKIELLKEQRTTLINHTVTKGLDPNVKMKPSGVDWIGDIPEGWGIKPLKYFSQITLGKMLTNEDKGGFTLKPYLRSVNIQSERVNIDDINEMWFSSDELIKLRLQKGDLLVNEGGDVGRTTIWNDELEECYIQNSVNRVRIGDGYNHYFLYHFLRHHFTGYFDSIVNRVSIPHLTKDKLSNITFCLPPLPEQHQIVEYLDQKTTEIDTQITLENKKIDLLVEYRQTLISNVVTGKIDVRKN